MNKGLAERKLKILKELLYRKCFFCEIIIESKYFEKTENIIPLCEFCLKKYQQLKKLDQEEKEIRITLNECFEEKKCLFCDEKDEYMGSNIFGFIYTCDGCTGRYKELKKIETDLKT